MKKPRLIYVVYAILTTSLDKIMGSDLGYSHPIAFNKIQNAQISCDGDRLNVTLTLQYPFKGLLFAKDFAQECQTFGSMNNFVSISLTANACGIRLSSRTNQDGALEMFYSVNLVVQQDRYLKQITDEEQIVSCKLHDQDFVVNSKAMSEILKNDLRHAFANHRSGRTRFSGWSKDIDEDVDDEDEFNEALTASRAWMEIVPEHGDKFSGMLKVGEPALLAVKSILPDGVGWKVVDCVAHDGLGDSSQKLLDERGCPIDDLVLPIPEVGPVKPIDVMRHQEAISRFSAFKFPDRARLYIACGLQLCRSYCTKVNCNQSTETLENRLGRNLKKGQPGELLDRLEVFNSVEVLAPDIDDLKKTDKLHVGDYFDKPTVEGELCVSPERMAMALCVAGAVFLGAVVTASLSLLRARRLHPSHPRSLLDNSSSAGSGYATKLFYSSQPDGRCDGYGRIL